MKAPILVVSDDVDLFASVDDAERYLEAWQIDSNLRVFDASGQPLRAVAVKGKLLAEVVQLEEDPDARPDPPALRAGLIRLIAGRERTPGTPEATIADLTLEALFVRARPHMTR